MILYESSTWDAWCSVFDIHGGFVVRQDAQRARKAHAMHMQHATCMPEADAFSS